jgi:hypothetical protein
MIGLLVGHLPGRSVRRSSLLTEHGIQSLPAPHARGRRLRSQGGVFDPKARDDEWHRNNDRRADRGRPRVVQLEP